LMTFGAADDLDLTRRLGLATAQEARAIGIQWVFAPVADVNNNPENPIINIRSFGDDPQLVARHVRAFIEGAHSDPANSVLVTAKHFPGHGDTNVDSHMGLPVLSASRERMNEVELVPFRAAAEAGVDAIMSAHIAVPTYDAEQTPATVSRPVLTGIIREQLGYKGLIVTDAMDMQGLTKQFSSEEAAARAVEAGADVLLMPPDPDAAVRGVLNAVRSGRITESRINESVIRILSAKARVGLHKRKLVDLENISDSLETEDHLQLAQTAADRGVKTLKNEAAAVPLSDPASACYWIMAESRHGQGGRRMQEEIRSRAKGARVALMDAQMPLVEIEDLWSRAEGCSSHVGAAFVTVGAYRGNVALGGSYPALMERMLASGRPTVLVSLGNPYLLRAFPAVHAFVATFSPAPTAEVAAVKALFGEIPIKAR
ncbi:MAG TPA: glycoside hydrolase family 3 N-terminal domain-containing protein, partial [Bryobacteraceae bacterium]|nr:glycoside hydrolase family 3 N-terminal domain-containing protein [Bryobacteraceae bacterium]